MSASHSESRSFPRRWPRRRELTLYALLLALLASYEPPVAALSNHPAELARRNHASAHPPTPASLATLATAELAASPPWRYIETGDLPRLAQRGVLRVLTLGRHEVEYPARVPDAQRQLVLGAAEALGLEVVWVEVDTARQLMDHLRAGKGDVAIGMAPIDGRPLPPGIDSTVPLGQFKYQAVARQQDALRLAGPESLYGQTIAVRAKSPVWPLIDRLTDAYPHLRFTSMPEYVDRDGLLAAVAAGQSDLAIISSQDLDMLLDNYPTLGVAFDLTSPKPLAWYTRSSNDALRAALDGYLEKYQPAHRPRAVYRADLDGIIERGVLRVITRPGPDGFYLDRGEPRGLDYELLADYAKSIGARIEPLVAANDEEMLAWLAAGRGDLIAAPVDPAGVVDAPEVERTFAYHYTAPVVVARAWDAVAQPEDLEDRRFVLPRTSPHWRTLERLRTSGVSIDLAEAPAGVAPEDLTAIVADGSYDLTVVDGDSVPRLLAGRPDLKAAMSLPEDTRYRWTVRAGTPQLLGSLNGYIARTHGSELHRVLTHRYLQGPTAVPRLAFQGISPFDDLVRASANEHGFDWRLIVSVMYQESQFDPRARSEAGATGLMQVMPDTAAAVGVADPSKPEQGITAGVRYLDTLRDRFETHLAVEDRTWFAVAAYHAGYSRVERARRVAAEMGLDPDRWFDNVEKAMLSLAGDGSGVQRYGAYRHTVAYVREVRIRYDAYVQVTNPVLAARGILPPRDRG